MESKPLILSEEGSSMSSINDGFIREMVSNILSIESSREGIIIDGLDKACDK